ncbi:unnamed protein product [Phytophthora fragariaefolia]|uniref:Unnamed protein product n=1 Tax=Phytophthora fragariaefolia TaxID=1490495 RepID=A0A9W6YF17_9STRA|nr:unnamed protein product [Phytophthora fragariaefolia]
MKIVRSYMLSSDHTASGPSLQEDVPSGSTTEATPKARDSNLEIRLQSQLQQLESRTTEQVTNRLQEFWHDIEGELQRQRSLQQPEMEQFEKEYQADIRHWNEAAGDFNAECIALATQGGVVSFQRLRKSIPGLGIPLPQSPAPHDSIPELAVGTRIPAEFFPSNAKDLESWTLEQISALSVLLNDTLGITAADSVAKCRLRVQRYLANY